MNSQYDVPDALCNRAGCGQTIPAERKRKGARYCSPACALRANNERRRYGVVITKRCAYCGQQFEAKRKNQIYHSPLCAVLAKERRNKRVFALPPPEAGIATAYHIDTAADDERSVMLPDFQIPFQDNPTVRSVLNFVKDYKPHRLFILGDFIDMYMISPFSRNPQRSFSLAEELSEGKFWLEHIREATGNDTEMWYIYGNHEDRLTRYLATRAPELAGIAGLGIHELLDLKRLNITPVAYGGYVKYMGYTIMHGQFVSNARPAAGLTARLAHMRVGGSGVLGHTHRLALVPFNDLHTTNLWIEAGCLTRKDPEWAINVMRGPVDWQWGFVYGVVHKGGLYLQPVLITNDGFVAMGKFYTRQ